MKNVTDFRKTVETGVDPHLIFFFKEAGVEFQLNLNAQRS